MKRHKSSQSRDGCILKAKPSRPFASLVFGDVILAWVRWGERPEEEKKRPAVFVNAEDEHTASALPIYSKPRNCSSIEAVLNGRRCHISRAIVRISGSDFVHATGGNLASAIAGFWGGPVVRPVQARRRPLTSSLAESEQLRALRQALTEED